MTGPEPLAHRHVEAGSPRTNTSSPSLRLDSRETRSERPVDRHGLCLVSVCTVNHLHFAKTLIETFRAHHTDSGAVLLVVDGRPTDEIVVDGATVLVPGQLEIPDFPYMALKYSATDLCCAMKPYLLSHVAAAAPWETILYADADIAFFAPAAELQEALREHTFVVTPHTIAPFPEPHRFWERPSLGDLAYAGQMNAGIFGFRVCDEAFAFLEIWSRLVTEPGAFLKALGGQMEQNSFNWIFSFAEDVHVLKDTGYNVAYWNLHDRSLRWNGLDEEASSQGWTVDGRPLVCYHFSGFSPTDPVRISKHDSRYSAYLMPSVASLLDFYLDRLRANGANEHASQPYRFGDFPSGCPIDDRMRTLFKTHEVFLRTDVDPWTEEGESHYGRALLSPIPYSGSLIPAIFQEIYASRPDLRAMSPNAETDPATLLQWAREHGIHEYGLARLFDHHRRAIAVPSRRGKVLEEIASLRGVLDGLPDPFGADRQELVTRLDRIGRSELAASLRRYEDESQVLTPVLSIRQAYQGRPDLRAAFPDVFDSDAERFASWLGAEGIQELGFPSSFGEAFRERARGRALARIFSYANRTWWAMEAFPLAFVGVGHRAMARAFFALLRHGLEFDLDDILFFVWTMDIKPWAGLPLALELAANIRRSPSTRLPAGQDALLRDVLGKSPEFGRALAEYRRRFSGPFFDEQHRLIERCERGEDRPVHVFDVMRDRRARSSPEAMRREGAGPAMAPPRPDRIRSVSGVNLFGFHKSPIGLGMATEGLVSALRSQDVPVARNLVGNVAMVRDLTPDDFLQKFDHRFDVNLFVSYPHHHDSLLNGLPRWMVDGRTNVVFLAWEQRDGTHYWRDAYSDFDQVWALSRFAAESLGRCLQRPVLPVPCVLETSVLPPAATKPEVGLENDRFVFLYVFDANSSIERKNPEAVIRAFARAFTEGDAASLVLKVSNADRLEHRPRLRRLLAEARERLGSRVRVLTENLSRRGVLQLLSAVDCYVSLHRAEGFGYTCAEAMAYGRPVVATRYSGNLDFMTDENSFLVDAREVLVEHPEGPFQRGSVWAEAEIEDAAAQLQLVYRDFDAALRRGQTAAADVRRILSPENVGRIVAGALRS